VILSFLMLIRLSRLLTRSVRTGIDYKFSTTRHLFNELQEIRMNRIISFWRAMKSAEVKSEEALSGVSLWDAITENQKDFNKLMDEGDPKKVFEYLSNAPINSLATGILQGKPEAMMLRVNPLYRRLKAKLTILRFVNLVESIGHGVKTQSPEQGPWGVDKKYRFSQALSVLDTELGTAVYIPQECYTGLFQVRIGDRYFNQVDLMAIYASMKIRDSVKESSKKSVLEIGGGSGSTAFWCHKLGIGPIHLVDLPHAAILQAFYLLLSLPESNIWLYGEKKTLNQVEVSIYPHFVKEEIKISNISVVFNQDSFAEMHTTVVQDYLKYIVRIGAKKLLSINHESEAIAVADGEGQVNLTGIIGLHPEFHLQARTPNWIRSGYVDTTWGVKS